MIEEGAVAPGFELPAVVDGEIEEVALTDHLGQEVVILAFYPADFNPACEGETTDLDELDLFTMQKDVSILAISTDSVYSHVAFADDFDLHIPLLSDPKGEVAEEYGVTVDEPAEDGHLTKRAVIVVDLDGEVAYAWATANLTELPRVEEVRRAVDDIGGDQTAEARYGVAHAHYVEGRRAFTSAMHAFEDQEWMMAEGDFRQAEGEFDEAADHFNTAVRFAEDEESQMYFERAEEKAQSLWQAAEWLADAASAYASGEGAEGESMREDAEGPLESARAIHEPVEPDEFPPDEDPQEHRDEADEEGSILPQDDDDVDASLEVDIDEEADTITRDEPADEAEGAAGETEPADGAEQTGAPVGGDADADEDEADEDAIGDAELEEITAELEEQTEQAQAEREAADEDATAEAAGDVAAPASEEGAAGDDGEVDGELDEDDIELDLADPTEGDPDAPAPDEAADLDDVSVDGEGEEADEDDEELESESGDHGVPDSL